MGKVIIAGSINMDIITRVTQLPQTGETISGKSVEYLPGGKGLNQAVASTKMGAETILISCLGNDVFANPLKQFIASHHIDMTFVKNSNKESGTAFITVANNGQNTIVVVAGSNADVSTASIEAVKIKADDIIVSQFEIPIAPIIALFQKAKQAGARTILNPSPIQSISAELMSLVDILIINETELGYLAQKIITPQTPVEIIIQYAQEIKSRPAQTIIVTLGAKGAVLVSDTACLIDGHNVAAIDTVGAGDCFAGVIAAQLLNQKNPHECVKIANKAASICVTRKGAAPSMPTAAELIPH